jgi:DNA-binding SARP family transcriptional activator
VGAAFELGILGPLQVVVDGHRPVALGGLRQRALLAILVLHANEIVSTDRLVDQLWGEHPPAQGRHTIQVFVSRLRHVLGSAGDRLVTRQPGYLLELGADELDSNSYEQLYGRARAALAGGDPARAVGLLRAGEALWRGSPLTDFTYESFAQATIARLDELHASSREELIEAGLALGAHADVVPDLEAFIREEPLRERPRRQLMLALYRCGRHADALDAFQQARYTLVEELGLEPSAELRELEQAILRQDPSIAGPLSPTLSLGAAPGAPPAREDSGPKTVTPAGAGMLPGPLPSALRSMPTSPFVGRDSEEQLARRAWEDTRRGSRSIFVIEGEPGVGKTRLAARTALHAHAEGTPIAWATATEGMGAPYAIWATVLSQVLERAPQRLVTSFVMRHGHELTRIVPALADQLGGLPAVRRTDPETERYLMFDAVVSLLELVASAAPVAIVLEDLHWADLPSLAMFEHVARATGHVPLLLLATYRDADIEPDHPMRDVLAALHGLHGVNRLTLHGLSLDEVAKLMEVIAGHEIGAAGFGLATDLAHETDGNPFFVVQILRHLYESGDIAQDENGRWAVSRLENLSLPPSVREVVARRVRRLGEASERILTLAAVAGQTFDVQLLESMAQAGEVNVLDALEAARRAGVLVESKEVVGRFTFTHALFNHSIYEGLGTTRRARIHECVAEALEGLAAEGSEPNVPELARHWLAAGSKPRKAVAYAQQAGQLALTQLAPDQAVRWFERALELVPPDCRQTRCELLIGLGESRRQIGDPSFRDRLLDASLLAEQLDDPERMTRAVVANTYGPFGAAGPRDDERIAAIERALDRLPADAPHVGLIQAILAKELYYGGEPQRGVELGEKALLFARRRSDRRELARVMSFTAAISPITPLEEHAARVRELARLGEDFKDPDLLFRAANLQFIHAMHSGNRGELDAALAGMMQLPEATRQPVMRWTSLWAQSAQQWIAGDLGASELLTMDAEAMAREHAIPEGALITFGQLLAVRTEQHRLDELLDRLADQLKRTPGLPVLHLARGFIDAEAGRVADAATSLERLVGDPLTFKFERTRAFNLARCADIALRVGALDIAERLYLDLLPYRTQFATTAGISTRGTIELNLGRLSTALGRHEAADEHLEVAARAHERFGAPLLEARTALAVGQSLLARGVESSAAPASDALTAAATVARKHGSVAIEREATRLLAVDAIRGDAPVPG